jgi:hypothetical protein
MIPLHDFGEACIVNGPLGRVRLGLGYCGCEPERNAEWCEQPHREWEREKHLKAVWVRAASFYLMQSHSP